MADHTKLDEKKPDSEINVSLQIFAILLVFAAVTLAILTHGTSLLVCVDPVWLDLGTYALGIGGMGLFAYGTGSTGGQPEDPQPEGSAAMYDGL